MSARQPQGGRVAQEIASNKQPAPQFWAGKVAILQTQSTDLQLHNKAQESHRGCSTRCKEHTEIGTNIRRIGHKLQVDYPELMINISHVKIWVPVPELRLAKHTMETKPSASQSQKTRLFTIHYWFNGEDLGPAPNLWLDRSPCNQESNTEKDWEKKKLWSEA